MILGKPEIVKNWAGKEQNVYRREVLYQEIWNFPVTEVAKKYAVSDVMIHKVCREMDIPTPPVGYWAKNRQGNKFRFHRCLQVIVGVKNSEQGQGNRIHLRMLSILQE